jgi:hypothetical protein
MDYDAGPDHDLVTTSDNVIDSLNRLSETGSGTELVTFTTDTGSTSGINGILEVRSHTFQDTAESLITTYSIRQDGREPYLAAIEFDKKYRCGPVSLMEIDAAVDSCCPVYKAEKVWACSVSVAMELEPGEYAWLTEAKVSGGTLLEGIFVINKKMYRIEAVKGSRPHIEEIEYNFHVVPKNDN